MKRLGFFAVCLLVAIACGETEGPTSPSVTPVEPVSPVVETVTPPETDMKPCEVLNVRQRRHKKDNVVILEVWPADGVERLVARFRINGKDFHWEIIIPNTRMEIELPLECKDKEYNIQVWVEGYLDGKLYQCDGSLYFTWKCKPKKPECSDPLYSNFYGSRKWHADYFDVYAGYEKLLGKGDFRMTLRRHRCASQLILGVEQHCHPENWEDSVSLDCFTGNSLQLVAKNQSSDYKNWCYTSELYLNGNLKEIRRIN